MTGAPSSLRLMSGLSLPHTQAMLPAEQRAWISCLMHLRLPLPSCQAGVPALGCGLCRASDKVLQVSVRARKVSGSEHQRSGWPVRQEGRCC